MEPVKEDSSNGVEENHSENEYLMSDPGDDNKDNIDFEVEVLGDLEDVETKPSFPVKEDSNKVVEENHSENEYLISDSGDDNEDDSDFEVQLLRDLEDVETKPSFLRFQEPYKGYKVMSEAEIRQCQERDINNISKCLSITQAEAVLLLRHFHWNVDVIPEEWFNNEQELRIKLKLSDFRGFESFDAKDMTCAICFGTFSQELIATALCGHIFCDTCWADYIRMAMEDGMASLMLRCPELSCTAPVGRDMINMLAFDDDKDAYAGYFLRSYVEHNPKAKWCPFRCNYAVILEGDTSGSKVTCECSNSFCFKCTKEPHQPISCAVLRNWQTESHVQSEIWSIGKTKSCPNCGTLVEVHDRHKRLECASCNFQFCKLCLVSWLEQSEWEHVCSEGKFKQPDIEEDEQVKEAQQRFNRYNIRLLRICKQILKRFRSCNMARMTIKRPLHDNEILLKAIADKQGLTEADMSFVKEAWLQIIECKRFFEWACVYDYYLKDGENEKQILFKYLTRRAEIILEHLYHSAFELITFLNIERPPEEFSTFRANLYSLTWVNKNYFNNMAWAIENNLNMQTLCLVMESRMSRVNTSAPQKDGRKRPFSYSPSWDCAWCLFENDASAWSCVMCYHP